MGHLLKKGACVLLILIFKLPGFVNSCAGCKADRDESGAQFISKTFALPTLKFNFYASVIQNLRHTHVLSSNDSRGLTSQALMKLQKN